MGSLWVYRSGYRFGSNFCCVVVGLLACGCCNRSMDGW